MDEASKLTLRLQIMAEAMKIRPLKAAMSLNKATMTEKDALKSMTRIYRAHSFRNEVKKATSCSTRPRRRFTAVSTKNNEAN